MSLLQEFNAGPKYLKAGFLGFSAGGKTHTSIELLIGTRALLGIEGPIAIYDTEGGSGYIADRIKERTGQFPLVCQSRSFDDLLSVGQEALKIGALMQADSVTHPWRELCDAYLKKVNADRKANNLRPRSKLEFQDWGIIKPLWGQWTNFYLNSPMHISVCGRAGFIYDFTEKDEETGKRELLKTGVKMNTETEFGFEPSLLVEMERIQKDENGRTTLYNQATVLKDRFNLINGKQCMNPTFEFFRPYVERLQSGRHIPIDTDVKSDVDADGIGDIAFRREKKEREILCEEIQGEILKAWPGSTNAEKQAKADILDQIFETRSWKKVESMSADRLRRGLERIRAIVDAQQQNTETKEEPTNEV
jgi:hypothetical protein